MTWKLKEVPYWAYCLILTVVGLVCFVLGRVSA